MVLTQFFTWVKNSSCFLIIHVALVPPGFLLPTQGALTLHEPVSYDPLAVGAVQLVHAVLLGVALLVQGLEDVLGYLCLLL